MFATRAALSRAVPVALAGAVAAASARYEHSSSRCDAPNNNSSLRSVTTRLGKYVRAVGTTDSGAVLVERPEARAVKIYSLAGHVAGGGLPVVRVAQTVIRAPVQDVANLWWSVNSRKDWDSVNTEDSKLVRTVSPSQRLVYLNGKPKRGGVISSRDFAYAMNRVPPQEVHAHVGSQLFVQVNAPDEEPLHKSSVRGDVNSMLLFEPIDAHTTKATYAIEMDVKGWLPTKVVNAGIHRYSDNDTFNADSVRRFDFACCDMYLLSASHTKLHQVIRSQNLAYSTR
eukprot:3096-Heterococcus_DN1.PRE.1